MRTTLVIEDSLYREVKSVAALQGATVSSLVEQALRNLLVEHSRTLGQGSEQLPPWGVLKDLGAPVTGVDLDDNSSVLAAMESIQTHGPHSLNASGFDADS